VFKNFLVIEERKEGLLNIRFINRESGEDHYLNFGEPTYTAFTSYNPEYDTDIIRYGYSSLTTPKSTYDYNMLTQTKILMKEQEVMGGGFDKQNYVSERVYATAADGVKIPISLVYRKGIKRDGSAPLYQYAYGSYGSSMDAYFSTARLSLLDRGFVFAICHIRGGQEMGRFWYEDGKLLKKKNTFTDFIACSEFLIKWKYTSADKLVASGGSAGGLLMGAISNMRPDLYKVIVADVPFVDVITTMMDSTIPLTTYEYDEWGNPNEKLYYDYMLSYSPYDQVKAQAYPTMLVTSGLHDSQVQYWEPAKWVAKLRTLKTDQNLLLFKTNMEAGHGGASGRFAALEEVAFEYNFLFEVLGVKR
jgi:oligopeptidase B